MSITISLEEVVAIVVALAKHALDGAARVRCPGRLGIVDSLGLVHSRGKAKGLAVRTMDRGPLGPHTGEGDQGSRGPPLGARSPCLSMETIRPIGTKELRPCWGSSSEARPPLARGARLL